MKSTITAKYSPLLCGLVGWAFIGLYLGCRESGIQLPFVRLASHHLDMVGGATIASALIGIGTGLWHLKQHGKPAIIGILVSLAAIFCGNYCVPL